MSFMFRLVSAVVAIASASALKDLSQRETIGLLEKWNLRHSFGSSFEDYKIDGYMLSKMTKALIDEDFPHVSGIHRKTLWSRIEDELVKQDERRSLLAKKPAAGKKPTGKGKFAGYIGLDIRNDKSKVSLGVKGDTVLYRAGPGAFAVDGEIAVKKLKADEIIQKNGASIKSTFDALTAKINAIEAGGSGGSGGGSTGGKDSGSGSGKKDCVDWQLSGAKVNKVYSLTDGTRHYCDLTTDGGGWTLIARVNSDFAWVCPSKKGGSCKDAKEPTSRANLFDKSHWVKDLKLEVQDGELSGVSTNPDIIRRYLGSGSKPVDVRFSFYGNTYTKSTRDDAYATFDEPGELFGGGNVKAYAKKGDYTWNVLKHSSKGPFSGAVVCWIGSGVDHRGYEPGLFMGEGTSCHLANNKAAVMMKSHYVNAKGWYVHQHALLNSGRLQAQSAKLAVWVRARGKLFPHSNCMDWKKAGATKSQLYRMTDGTSRYCDMTTEGGGWSLIARVNSDFEWVCPSKKGGNCNGAKESKNRANLFDSSHWSNPMVIEPQAGALSGVSTKPSTVRTLIGTGAFDLRFSFYGSAGSNSPRDDAYATFMNIGSMFGDGSTVKALSEKGDFSWTIIKQQSTRKTFSGRIICWISSGTSARGYEPGLFMGSGGSCHLNNDHDDIMVKSHYVNSKGWYGGQHALLNSGSLQVKSGKIAIWVRNRVGLYKYKDCMAWKKAGAKKNKVYTMADGTSHYCDMTTEGGGWTMIARVNKDFEWVCPSKKGGNCNGAKESKNRANLFDASHWFSPVTLAGQPGARSGASTNPKTVRHFMGSGPYDLRFSFYSSASSTEPRDDAYATFATPGSMFNSGAVKLHSANGDYTWTILKQGNTKKVFGGTTICWITSGFSRGYEPGLFMGKGSCHLDNDHDEIMVKSHYTNAKGWYGGQHALLNSGSLQAKSGKIAMWVRDRTGLYKYKDCMAWKKSGAKKSQVYTMADGTAHYCDMTTAGGGWTMIARVNSDFEWVCPSKKGGNCNGAKEPKNRANLFDSSHWFSPVALAGQPGARSGVSTNPKTVRKFTGSGAFDLRFSFYSSAGSTTPRDDAYASFKDAGDMFSNHGTVAAKKNSQYTWKILKNGAKKKFSGSTICWIPGSKKTGIRGYEAGLFMGRGSCHLDNDHAEIMVKSHYTNAKGWYGGQHALLNSGSLQAKSGKIAIWVRAK